MLFDLIEFIVDLIFDIYGTLVELGYGVLEVLFFWV